MSISNLQSASWLNAQLKTLKVEDIEVYEYMETENLRVRNGAAFDDDVSIRGVLGIGSGASSYRMPYTKGNAGQVLALDANANMIWTDNGGGNTGVQSVEVSAPLVETGTATAPNIGLATTGITAGNRTNPINLNIDQYGRVLACGSASNVVYYVQDGDNITISGADDIPTVNLNPNIDVSSITTGNLTVNNNFKSIWTTNPTSNGKLLSSDTSGNLSWVSQTAQGNISEGANVDVQQNGDNWTISLFPDISGFNSVGADTLNVGTTIEIDDTPFSKMTIISSQMTIVDGDGNGTTIQKNYIETPELSVNNITYPLNTPNDGDTIIFNATTGDLDFGPILFPIEDVDGDGSNITVDVSNNVATVSLNSHIDVSGITADDITLNNFKNIWNTDPTENGQVLVSDTTGNLSWYSLPVLDVDISSTTLTITNPDADNFIINLPTTGVVAQNYSNPVNLNIDAYGRINSCHNAPNVIYYVQVGSNITVSGSDIKTPYVSLNNSITISGMTTNLLTVSGVSFNTSNNVSNYVLTIDPTNNNNAVFLPSQGGSGTITSVANEDGNLDISGTTDIIVNMSQDVSGLNSITLAGGTGRYVQLDRNNIQIYDEPQDTRDVAFTEMNSISLIVSNGVSETAISGTNPILVSSVGQGFINCNADYNGDYDSDYQQASLSYQSLTLTDATIMPSNITYIDGRV